METKDDEGDELLAVDAEDEIELASKQEVDTLAGQLQVANAQMRLVMKNQQTLSEDLYKSTIRIEGIGLKVKEFHQTIKPLAKELSGKKEVAMIKTGTFHMDIVMKEMTDPKGAVTYVRDFLKNKHVDKQLRTMPPIDPGTDQIRQTAKDAHRALLQQIEYVREDADDRLPKEMKPKTRWPRPLSRRRQSQHGPWKPSPGRRSSAQVSL